MAEISASFGVELRRHRNAAGLSLDGLAKKINFSKSHLSKVERGVKNPSIELVRACESALDAKGVLSALIRAAVVEGESTETDAVEWAAVWSLHMQPDGRSDFLAFDPAGPGGGIPVSSMVGRPVAPALFQEAEGEAALASFRGLYDEYRRMGQVFGPAVVTQLLVSAAGAMRGIACSSPPAQRSAALRLAARFAEYTGWMAQEAGNDTASLWWTDQAAALASAGEDDELVAYAVIRRAELALYRDDSVSTVKLAQLADSRTRSKRIRAMAAQREAQGHALMGDDYACLRALERGAVLMSEAAGESGGPEAGPLLGSTHLTRSQSFVDGWCMYDLGRQAEALTALGGGLDAIPVEARRARARYGARLALVLAQAGDIDRACKVAEEVASSVVAVDSATIRADLRQLRRTLGRMARNPTARNGLARIATALHTEQHLSMR